MRKRAFEMIRLLTSIAGGSKRRIKSAAIASRTEFPSAMSPAFGQILTKRQIRDLVQYLATVQPQ